MSPTGPNYAETLPPKSFLALRAYAPSGQITLAALESVVTGADAHGGGWTPIVIQKVCSQTLDAANYTTCIKAAGWVDLGDLNTFLTWMQSAGQSGGAPAGAVMETMGAAAASADTVAPTTAIACNGAPCASSMYNGSVVVTLSAVDTGSGVASTHFTIDGSVPTLSSPSYTGPFTLTGSATIQFASWDNAGNAEPATAAGDPDPAGRRQRGADHDHVLQWRTLRQHQLHGAGDGGPDGDRQRRWLGGGADLLHH